ncbi:PD-(D/E)XK nuclease family protein [Helicobacter trogontum]|uniref:PD-(D/E)XK nuclease family protein n=1 Tax=Helicobacter trogontum TaxID=50960 RepID=UPI00398A4607
MYARDQNRQIERYIDAIFKDCSCVESSQSDFIFEESSIPDSTPEEIHKNIAVLYLTLEAKSPTSQSLGKWQILGNYLRDNQGNQVQFKTISYKNEILKWIESA